MNENSPETTVNIAAVPETVLKRTDNVEVVSFSIGNKEFVGKAAETIRNSAANEGEGHDAHIKEDSESLSNGFAINNVHSNR